MGRLTKNPEIKYAGKDNDMALTEEQKKKTAWERARKIEGYDAAMFRQDACGAWIIWDQYGNRENSYGWEIDHILPISKGGRDIADNLRALQHQNNASKGDDYPSYTAVVVADGTRNIRSVRNLTVNKQVRERLRQFENF